MYNQYDQQVNTHYHHVTVMMSSRGRQLLQTERAEDRENLKCVISHIFLHEGEKWNASFFCCLLTFDRECFVLTTDRNKDTEVGLNTVEQWQSLRYQTPLQSRAAFQISFERREWNQKLCVSVITMCVCVCVWLAVKSLLLAAAALLVFLFELWPFQCNSSCSLPPPQEADQLPQTIYCIAAFCLLFLSWFVLVK